MQLNLKAAIFAVALALVASTGLASRSLMAQAPAPGPGSCMTVVDIAREYKLTTALIAAAAANLTSTLSDPNLAYTFFVPTNQAFADASKSLNVSAQEILNNEMMLREILDNHLLPYPLPVSELLAQRTIATEYGYNETLTVTQAGNAVQVATPVAIAEVVQANIIACKSIVHIVNRVLIPLF